MNPGPPDTQSDSSTRPAGPPVRLGKFIRNAIRTAWDALGFVCLASVTVFASTFAAALTPISVAARLGLLAAPASRVASWTAAVVCAVVVVPPLYAGACWLANIFIEHDEPSYGDLWRGARRLFGRAVAIGAIQAFVGLLIVSNLVFYLSRTSVVYLLLSVLFIYLGVFWLMQMLYHMPLLVAAERGLLKREVEGRTPVSTIFRNAFVITLASPGYTFGLAALLAALLVPSIASGAGAALIYPGFAAFLTMQAVRDQLVRFGHIDPPPDPEEPVPDERWRVE